MPSFNSLQPFGWTSSFLNCLPENCIPGRILSDFGREFLVKFPDTECRAILSGSVFTREETPIIGDWIFVHELSDSSKPVISGILPRYNILFRKKPGKLGKQFLGANLDYCFLMQGLDDDYNLSRLERFLGLSLDAGIPPVVVLNKRDIAVELMEKVASVRELLPPSVPIFTISAKTGEGMEELQSFLQTGTTIAVLGSSGAGKSTFLNTLLGEETQKTNEVRQDDSKGRHTTVHRELFLLPQGALLLDSPGIRELQLWEPGKSNGTAFPDILELAQKCKFRDCQHQEEPGCAVREALELGILSERRYKNYLKLQKEEKYLRQLGDEVEARKKRQEDKKLHKLIRRTMKNKKKNRFG
ncbi:MAG: ribosome small subunit-dependent GTPase A [Spirochaetota bacterium]